MCEFERVRGLRRGDDVAAVGHTESHRRVVSPDREAGEVSPDGADDRLSSASSPSVRADEDEIMVASMGGLARRSRAAAHLPSMDPLAVARDMEPERVRPAGDCATASSPEDRALDAMGPECPAKMAESGDEPSSIAKSGTDARADPGLSKVDGETIPAALGSTGSCGGVTGAAPPAVKTRLKEAWKTSRDASLSLGRSQGKSPARTSAEGLTTADPLSAGEDSLGDSAAAPLSALAPLARRATKLRNSSRACSRCTLGEPVSSR